MRIGQQSHVESCDGKVWIIGEILHIPAAFLSLERRNSRNIFGACFGKIDRRPPAVCSIRVKNAHLSSIPV